ncbi:hypothetical protein BKA63DRAFT_532522 [Paraphoma chrysanthemicola]|nr:hypothetical protein BKA63DRAFT_532522 [Paraphoma chrysanthemicola]
MSNPGDYTIGWICALHEELVAATAFLDEEHDPPDRVSRYDANDYTLGKIGRHNVVIAVLPSSEYGTASAAGVARDMVHSFPNIRLGLMVGIGGGVPSEKHDIRLGDVVVSNSDRGSGSVFQYDFGKMIQGQGFQTTGVLDRPPRALRTAVNGLRARHARTGHDLPLKINDAFEKFPKLRSKYSRPSICTDILYQPAVIHPENQDGRCAQVCGDDPAVLVSRSQRTDSDDNPAIHYGVIASGNQVMKHALIRDSVATANDVLCFEMEAAGLMNTFPCLVIRGICDYADSHKKKEWQGYAAMTAAAYTKDLLLRIVPDSVQAERKLTRSHALTVVDDVATIRKATEEIYGISKQQLEIQQEAMKQSITDKETNCLHLFRRTNSGKDDTYEWSKDRVADRVEGTCNWLSDHDNFKEWLTQESGLLLVSADPGCGKSVLAKYLVDCYLPRQLSPVPVTICYFFFRDPDQSTIPQALCALLHQLFCQKPHLIHHAMKEYEQNGKHLINSSQSLWNTLKRAVEDPKTGPVIILLDALDECADLNDLMGNLQAHVHSQQFHSGQLRYLLTSRPYEPIISTFRGLWDAFPQIHIPGEESSEIISQEINRVIEYKINQLAEQQKLSEQVKSHLASCFLKIPHRTYLWVYFVFDELRSEGFKKTLKGVESVTSTLPKTINEAYERILSKSKEDKMVRKALSIILAAEWPLTLGEMNVALSIESTSKSFEDLDLESDSDFQSSLRSLCGLFVSVYRGRVYFLHQTAREFLLAKMLSSPGQKTEPQWHQSITMLDAQRVLASLCVRYLNFFNSDQAARTDTTSECQSSTVDRTFLDYSARFWGTHFRKAHIGVSDDDAVVRLGLEISNPNCRAYSVTALLGASYMGHEAVVKLLLDKGADVNARHYKNRSALIEASSEGYETIVKLLLDKGANVNTQDKTHRTALTEACCRGYEAIVKLLLDNGADVNVQDGSHRNALSEASYGGHEAVVTLLLDEAADIVVHSGGFRDALHISAYRGHTRVLELLMTKATSMPLRDRQCGKISNQPQKPFADDLDIHGRICDVCTCGVELDEFYFHCRYCANGDWDMCVDCKERGAFCGDASHVLLKQPGRRSYRKIAGI